MLWRDVSYAWRVLIKSPLVTGIAVLSLGLAIGANTAIFSLVNALMLRSLPVPEPHELVSIGMTWPVRAVENHSMSLEIFEEARRQQTVFSGVFAWMGGGVENMEANGDWYSGSMNTVSGEYYATLGVKPLLGRLIGPKDVRLDTGWAEKVAVLDYRCWTRRFAQNPQVLGKVMRIGGEPVTIVGVTPPEFTGLYIDGQTDLTSPLGYSGRLANIDRHNFWFDEAIGRLRHGVTIDRARAQLQAIWPRIVSNSLSSVMQAHQRQQILQSKPILEHADRGFSFQRDRLRVPLRVLMALVGVLLLIACVNLANLMLARATTRQFEFAVRFSFGASRWQIARQLLTESLMMSFGGAMLGVLIAIYASRLLERMLWRALIPVVLNTDPDWRVLSFTLAITLSTGMLFGMAPLARLRACDPALALGQNSRTIRRGPRSIVRALIYVQLALSLVLIIGAALFVRSIEKLETFDPGFNRKGILTLWLTGKPGIHDQDTSAQAAYYRNLADRLSRVPGVGAVSFSSMGPGTYGEHPVRVVLRPGVTGNILAGVVSPGFFDEIGMRIVDGRGFTWADNEHSARVGVVSQSFARRFFQGGYVPGNRITLDADGDKRELAVVGVVSDASLWSLKSRRPMAVYEALAQNPNDGFVADLRFSGDLQTIELALRQAVESLGWQFPVLTETLDAHEDRFLKEGRVVALIAAFLGGLTVLLSAVGIYGFLSEAVASRTSEIGVRVALGASESSIVWLVMREVAVMCAVGLPVGVVTGLAASRLIAGMLYDLAPDDPLMIAFAVGVLGAVAFMAAFRPARRASRIDPMQALRSE